MIVLTEFVPEPELGSTYPSVREAFDARGRAAMFTSSDGARPTPGGQWGALSAAATSSVCLRGTAAVPACERRPTRHPEASRLVTARETVMTDLSDLAGGATSPLQTLMELLNPEKQQWLKAQPQDRQQQLAESFATQPYNMQMPGVTSNPGIQMPDLKAQQGHANDFIQDAQDGNR
ncbi:hypothetical protein GCM10010277_77790 [Streptomyces longisporoflavus]|nr:hypothetical protein GCM10010277_77790 [Streptomyces longisporoflavus]